MKQILTILLFTCAILLRAQCPAENKAFVAGEKLSYDLYFNWNFIWIKAGTAYYSTKSATYNGEKCLRTDLISLSNKRCSAFFPMKDTIMAYLTEDLVPLYFRKGADEGKRYTVDQVWYSYKDGKTMLKQRYKNHKGKVYNYSSVRSDCVYDMASMLSLARSFDPNVYCKKSGQRFTFNLASGDEVQEEILEFNGRKKWKANDGVTYKCLIFTLIDDEDEKKERRLLTFYITDDDNHLPIRIDFYLKFGTAKAFLTKSENVKNPQTSIVKKK
ncbi:MAG: DUF3108 domain-containing protein [Bacteroidaceae bacterium]|nr:DUF3108 domain-containing protein [Bacteroidaceae bacterium]